MTKGILTILTNSIPAANKIIELKEQYESFDCKTNSELVEC